MCSSTDYYTKTLTGEITPSIQKSHTTLDLITFNMVMPLLSDTDVTSDSQEHVWEYNEPNTTQRKTNQGCFIMNCEK